MEELFVGNSVILLFWVYISFIIDIDEYYKKIILILYYSRLRRESG